MKKQLGNEFHMYMLMVSKSVIRTKPFKSYEKDSQILKEEANLSIPRTSSQTLTIFYFNLIKIHHWLS
jgi:hypothetical protein